MNGMNDGQAGRNVLVAYATRAGSTREIAETIGAVLAGAGYRVTVRPVGEVADIADYDVVVLGSAMYLTRWRREAVRFLRRHCKALSGRDVWLFQSGPCGAQDAALQLPMPGVVRRLAEEIGAQPAVTFGGKLDRATARGLLSRWVTNDGLAGDWRDWDQIRAWATSVAAQESPHG
jgi:menaquinone-dependent protoporphyrinogen oxidase